MPRYDFTPESTVKIQAQSSMHPIEGETHGISGHATVEVDNGQLVLDPPPSGYVEMPVDELESGHKLQDKEMRRRVDAKEYPVIRYQLDEVSGGPEEFKLVGTLTFHGVSQQFSEDASARIEGDTLYVDGQHTFDIRDFDVKPPKILNLQVYPEVLVVANLVGRAS